MKRAFFLCFFIYAFGLRADLFPLATIMGAPDMTQNFVRNLVRKEIEIPIQGAYEINLSTELYSLLGAEGASNTLLVKAFADNYSMSFTSAIHALHSAASEANVVMWIFRAGFGSHDQICEVMTHYPDVAFVMAAGSDAQAHAIDPLREPHCQASNILIVAALDQNHAELASFSNYGPFVRLAAPGVMIPVVSAGGVARRRSGLTPAVTFAAAQLAQHIEKAPGLRGAALIEDFLATETLVMPNLLDKVTEGRAILSRHELPHN